MLLPLKQLRKCKGISQSKLGRALEVSPSAVGMWEQGRREPDCKMLSRIADFFDVPVDYLLGRITPKLSFPALSEEQIKLLDDFDSLNSEGQNAILLLLKLLRMSHSKKEAAKNHNATEIIQNNSGGTNYIATGGNNSYTIAAQ